MTRKIIAGWRYFHCSCCGKKWREKCRDCHSPSQSSCPTCQEYGENPDYFEEHSEWAVDKHGNLLED